jgi:hypothetical protein
MNNIILKSIFRPILIYLAIGLIIVLFRFSHDLREWRCDHVGENGQPWYEGFNGPLFQPADNCTRINFTKETVSLYPLQIILWPAVIMEEAFDD